MSKRKITDSVAVEASSNSCDNGLTEYEQLRADNIKRNEAFLESLGLNNVKPPPPVVKAVSSSSSNKSKRRSFKVEEEPVRRSSRVLGGGIKVEGDEGFLELSSDRHAQPLPKKLRPVYELDVTADEDDVDRHKVTAPALRALIDARNMEHSSIISDEVRMC